MCKFELNDDIEVCAGDFIADVEAFFDFGDVDDFWDVFSGEFHL